MIIRELYRTGKPLLSFEVFPPKKDRDIENMDQVLASLAALQPGFISVTCGAGGSAPGRGGAPGGDTVQIARQIRSRHGISALAHLTCVARRSGDIEDTLREMRSLGIENVLALRGDLPEGMSSPEEFRYAEDLIRAIRSRAPSLCIGAACYPEGHIDCEDERMNLLHAKRKQDAGADFLVSQLFFDNALFFRFLDSARAAGIRLPISAGVMPILSRSQIERMIFLCGASLPSRIIKLLHRHEHSAQDLRKAGIEYACEQARELSERGVDGIHIYTMNHPDIAASCAAAVR